MNATTKFQVNPMSSLVENVCNTQIKSATIKEQTDNVIATSPRTLLSEKKMYALFMGNQGWF